MPGRGEPRLYETLTEYCRSDRYPFHMPGHKRRSEDEFVRKFPNPYMVDITEIDGFDNLHHPEGILRESMDWAARIYGSDKTYYLVNGSTCGILSVILAAADVRDGQDKKRILLARNSHKSAYHGLELSGLEADYIYPRVLPGLGLQGGIIPEDAEKLLTGRTAAAFVVSPTYDGIVSDIRRIADVCHLRGVPLIVDEAHGAHFPFGESFPQSALAMGADAVIQSLHKTLPSFTQTAVLHVRQGLIDLERLEHYLQIFQSSSPSYVLMAGIERCIQYMDGPGRQRMKLFGERIGRLRKDLAVMRNLCLLDEDLVGRHGVYDLDQSKIVVSSGDAGISGIGLAALLREKYNLEMEMWGSDYVTAITTLMDTEEGLERLKQAFLEIDRQAVSCPSVKKNTWEMPPESPGKAMTIGKAWNCPKTAVKIEESSGRVSGEYVYLYPPGIPVIVPGERISPEIVRTVCESRNQGLPVQGLKDYEVQYIEVIDET